ncbi:hypothetical protein TVAG_296950 [Trichomonas vaginalis G3]|uniref:Inner centromere protein ARK-binding domain-containing protein n=1 Tax=Trichomonas vaginalis (strain ATCC PRA-98 / G3) TaxID=412133 RepID=A2DR90_TRIV3|nr:inner centromere protein, ARK binding region-containing protein [Trichomonas vaginalis G3]EAY17016.1 hypothetical protein TVAG_296950 [Trichomonas vaginalis G3]KAI5517881.1 inner centromere protein, ARK binding region-containing protein [Trichomonas vaginalis G3]|eukprot:XP_001329239.1 hypothetical protein [Trichomonas vaginalis G3]
MHSINTIISDLDHLLNLTFSNYKRQEEVHFDWLNTISFQLNLFSSSASSFNSNSSLDSKDNDERPIGELRNSINSPIKSELKHSLNNSKSSIERNNQNSNSNVSRDQESSCLSTNSLSTSSIKFICDDSILIETSSDDDNTLENNELYSPPASPFALSGSVEELTQSAYSFREAWKEKLNEKKQEVKIKKTSFKFAFEEAEEESENYQMSDDCDEGNEFEDEYEMYERNPIEIHGKTIPHWARGEQLEKELKKQYHINPDEIFFDFPMECNLEEIFDRTNQKWAKRNESGYWAHDGITREEIENYSKTRFKNI